MIISDNLVILTYYIKHHNVRNKKITRAALYIIQFNLVPIYKENKLN